MTIFHINNIFIKQFQLLLTEEHTKLWHNIIFSQIYYISLNCREYAEEFEESTNAVTII